MGERNEALGQVRECVRLDEEEKTCWALYKKLKKFTKVLDELQGHMDGQRYVYINVKLLLLRRWDQALKSIKEAKAIEKTEPFYVRYLSVKECVCLANGNKANEALQVETT